MKQARGIGHLERHGEMVQNMEIREVKDVNRHEETQIGKGWGITSSQCAPACTNT